MYCSLDNYFDSDNQFHKEFSCEKERQPTTKVFAKAGLDNVTSAMCRHQQRFRLDVHYSALVHNFNHIFPSGHLYRAGRTMNSLPSQILERCMQAPTDLPSI